MEKTINTLTYNQNMAQFQSRITWRWQVPKEIKLPLGLMYLCAMISWLISLSTYFSLQPAIPLFYTLAQPEQQLVVKEWIFLFPILFSNIKPKPIFTAKHQTSLRVKSRDRTK